MNREECFAKTTEYFTQKQIDIVARQSAHREEIFKKFPEVEVLTEKIENIASELFEKMMSQTLTTEDEARIEETSLALQKQVEDILISNGYGKDYLKKQYDCPECKDEGYIGQKMCKCFKKALAEEYFRHSNLQNIYNKKNFRNFDLTFYPEGEQRSRMETIQGYCKKFVKDFDKVNRNLIFFGAPGCGKTFLSVAIGVDLISSGHFVFYTPVQDMLDDFEKVKFDKGHADIEAYTECDLLIIDDFGSEFRSAFTDSVLYNVINNRLNAKKPIIISTNLNEIEIADNYHERLVSRIMFEFAKLPFSNTDIRREKEKRLIIKADKRNG